LYLEEGRIAKAVEENYIVPVYKMGDKYDS
jgi:hypothetical protein